MGWLLLAVPAALQAQFTFTTNAGVVTLSSYANTAGPVSIPNFVNCIGANAFLGDNLVTGVTIPASVSFIGSRAFENCTGLGSFSIPATVTSMDDSGDQFLNCTGLTNVSIAAASIPGFAFYNCIGLTTVTIAGTVTSIDSEDDCAFAFAGCPSLTAINVDGGNMYYSSVGGVMFNQAQTGLLVYPSGLAGSYTIPSSVTGIGDNAFAYCDLLTNVTIPNSVTNIAANAFTGCPALTSVTIPPSITSLWSWAFFDCGLTNVCFEGNAPTEIDPGNGGIFALRYPEVIHYVTGTTGWEAAFEGIPTAPCAECGTVPVIPQVSNQFVICGQTLSITNSAAASTPPVTFSLAGSAPAGADITSNGVLIWTPSCEQGGTTNVITVWAVDSGNPALSNSMTFTVTVSDCLQMGIGSTVMQVGQSGSIPVSLLSTFAITNLSFSLVSPAISFTNWTVASSNPSVGAAGVQCAGSAPPWFTLATAPGKTLYGPSSLESIAFTALPGDSALVPVVATNIVGIKSDGTGVGNTVSLPGQVVVIGLHPLLTASLGNNAARTLTVYGNPGSNYQMAFSTNLPSTNWQPAGSILMTNLWQNFNVNQTAPQIYYRAQ